MDRNRQPLAPALFGVDVMAARHTPEAPLVAFEKAAEVPSGQGLHTAISSTLSLANNSTAVRSTDKQPSTAS